MQAALQAFAKIEDIAKFALVGCLNTMVGLSIIYALKWQFAFTDASANLSGYAIALTVSFWLNRNWTFRHTGPAWPAAIRFLSVFATAYLINLLTVLSLIQLWHVDGYIAQALGVPPYTAMFYLGSRYFAFPR